MRQKLIIFPLGQESDTILIIIIASELCWSYLSFIIINAGLHDVKKHKSLTKKEGAISEKVSLFNSIVLLQNAFYVWNMLTEFAVLYSI